MTTTHRTSLPFETMMEPFEEFGEQMLGSARTAGTKYLDSYEKAVGRALELEVKLAGTSRQEWLTTLVDAHVDLTRELTAAYTAAARQMLG